MFCKNCGKEVENDARFCPHCGYDMGGVNVEQEVNNFTKKVDNQFESSINEIRNDFSSNSQPTTLLRTDRSLLMYILLSIITCGIYSYYYIYKIAKDVNVACEGDGEVTGGLAAFIIFSFLTCGIYSFYWQYKIGNRIQMNGSRYGLNIVENGTSILLWDIFGILLCGIGPFIAMHIIIKNVNMICAAYNRTHMNSN